MHCYEVVRHWNNEINTIDTSISLLIDQNLDGETLNETLEQLQAWIAANCNNIRIYLLKILQFIQGWDSYAESQYTDLDYQIIINANNFINKHADDLEQDIFGPAINNKAKLAQLYSKYSNALPLGNPVIRSDEVVAANRVNIYVDAAAHTLRGINEADGTSLGLSDFATRELTRRYLEKVNRIAWLTALPTLQSDMEHMVTVTNYVLTDLLSGSLTDLADYIDAQVPKIPLFRKLWMTP